MKTKRIASEVLLDLSSRMDQYPARSKERKNIIKSACELYSVSESTLYRQLRSVNKPKPLKRIDSGKSRVIPIWGTRDFPSKKDKNPVNARHF